MTLALYGKSRRRQGTLVALAAIALLAAIAGGLLATEPFDARAAIFESDDVDGANDEAGQKDLTWLLIDDAGLPQQQLFIQWNWDITGLSGNNTGDACALFDADNNQLVDFSVCAVWGETPPVPLATIVYTCGDEREDRCSQPIAPVSNPSSVCDVALSEGTDPFVDGADAPDDTRATCTVELADVGFPTGRLLNVCSYPSGQPNSDPSDCVLQEPFVIGLDITTAVSATEVEVGGSITDTATLSGSVASPSGTVDFFLCGPDVAGACEAGGTLVGDDVPTSGATETTTAALQISTTGFDAGQYCFRVEYTPDEAALAIGYVADSHFDAETECFTVVEPEPETGTISVTKIVTNVDGDTTEFDFTIPGAEPSEFTLQDGQSQNTTVDAGDHTVTEAAEDGYTTLGWLIAAECPSDLRLDGDEGPVGDTDNTAEVSVEAGETVNVCFYNSKDPVTKTLRLVKSDANGAVPAEWTLTIDDSPAPDNDVVQGQGTVEAEVGIDTVIHIEESGPEGWRLDSIVCDGGIDPLPNNSLFSRNIQLSEEDPNLVTCTFTNESFGNIEVVKVDSVPGVDTWNFTVTGTDFGPLNDFINDSGSFTINTVSLGTYAASEAEAQLFADCPDPNPEGLGYFTTLSTPDGTTIDEPGETIRFIFTNQPCPTVEATGTLIIEKWHDVDGDGQRDGGEPALQGWTMTVTGPQFPGGASFDTDASGQVILPGIFAGIYTVSEAVESGWFNTGRIVDGVVLAASTSAIAEVVDGEDEEELVTTVEFGNRQLGSIRVVKIVSDQLGTTSVAGWQFLVTGGCDGVAIGGTTGATGQVTFPNLKPTDNCAPYLVTELAANTNGFLTSPSGVQGATVASAQETTVTFTNSRGTTPQPTPPVNPTPTNTVPPTATPTATPEETVAGEITPGPGGEATPIAPETGSGASGGAGGVSIALLLMGMAALTMGAGVLAVARKR